MSLQNNDKKSAENLTWHIELKEEIRQVNETLKHFGYINTRLSDELKDKEAIISNLQNSYSWRITAPLRWTLDRLSWTRDQLRWLIGRLNFLVYNRKINLLISYFRLFFILFFLFFKVARRFLSKLDPGSITLFFKKIKKMHPKSLEYEVKAKLNLDIMQGQAADAPGKSKLRGAGLRILTKTASPLLPTVTYLLMLVLTVLQMSHACGPRGTILHA